MSRSVRRPAGLLPAAAHDERVRELQTTSVLEGAPSLRGWVLCVRQLDEMGFWLLLRIPNVKLLNAPPHKAVYLAASPRGLAKWQATDCVWCFARGLHLSLTFPPESTSLLASNIRPDRPSAC